MPQYRLIAQTTISPEVSVRAARSTVSRADSIVVDVDAATLAEAVIAFGLRHATDRQPPRLVSAEEYIPLDVAALSDERLARALVEAPNPIDFDGWAAEVSYEDVDFESLVDDIADALRDSGLVPGLHFIVHRDSNGAPEYTSVEIHDQATGSYRSVGRASRDLIDDRSLVGRPAILSIARTLITIAATEHLL